MTDYRSRRYPTYSSMRLKHKSNDDLLSSSRSSYASTSYTTTGDNSNNWRQPTSSVSLQMGASTHRNYPTSRIDLNLNASTCSIPSPGIVSGSNQLQAMSSASLSSNISTSRAVEHSASSTSSIASQTQLFRRSNPADSSIQTPNLFFPTGGPTVRESSKKYYAMPYNTTYNSNNASIRNGSTEHFVAKTTGGNLHTTFNESNQFSMPYSSSDFEYSPSKVTATTVFHNTNSYAMSGNISQRQELNRSHDEMFPQSLSLTSLQTGINTTQEHRETSMTHSKSDFDHAEKISPGSPQIFYQSPVHKLKAKLAQNGQMVQGSNYPLGFGGERNIGMERSNEAYVVSEVTYSERSGLVELKLEFI